MAAPKGVEAWTSGSQTYIRARPSADTPPVAKVPRHTALHVWGKFQGWYRVETHDHIFGWVFNQYLNSSGLEHVAALSQNKARVASNRTANQTMYGTPEELRAHLKRYAATGAVKGLALQGVYVAPRPRLVKAAPPKAKPAVKMVASHPLQPRKTAPVTQVKAPSMAAQVPVKVASRPAPPVKVAALPSAVGQIPVPETTAPQVAPAAAPSGIADALRSKNDRSMNSEAITGALNSAMANSETTTPVQPVVANVAPAAAAPVLPKAVVPVAPSAAVSPAAPAPVMGGVVTPVPAIRPVVPKFVAPKPVVKTIPAKPLAPKKVAMAPKPVPAKSKQKPLTWRQKRYLAKVSAKQHSREGIRKVMGWSSKGVVVAGGKVQNNAVTPFAPDALVSARDSYLKKQQPATTSAPLMPVGNLAPLPPANATGGNNQIAPAPPANISPSSFVGSPELAKGIQTLMFGNAQQQQAAAQTLAHLGEDETSGVLADVQNAPAGSIAPVLISTAQVKPTASAKPAAATGPSRGGSPTDRAVAEWRSGMASQALSYRGMPYRFGAASPKRGFDCSGLIYFLLRQRGYNPPRTAAGYRNYGKAVGRGQWQTGDLILFANTYKRGISHIGIYLGNGKFVHAATSGSGVRVDALSSSYYAKKYWGARRVR